MEKRRLFIAINLPENIKNKLIKYQKQWADLPVRWTIKSNLHITLVFIGYVNDDEMYEIINIVKKVSEQHEPFNINLEKIILGPASAKASAGRLPRMFWVEGENSSEIAKLKDNLENSLLSSQNSGYKKKETRSYKPHITLGRIKTGQWRKLDVQPKIDEKFEHSFLIETIEVMQSNLKRSGAEYSVLESISLG